MEHAPDQIDDGRLRPGGEGGRIATDRRADDRKDAGADDDADAERGEGDGAKGLLEGVLGQLRFRDQLVDGFSSEYLAVQGLVL
jgi:hypothetical protein